MYLTEYVIITKHDAFDDEWKWFSNETSCHKSKGKCWSKRKSCGSTLFECLTRSTARHTIKRITKNRQYKEEEEE